MGMLLSEEDVIVFNNIIEIICKKHDVSKEEILGTYRHHHIVKSRRYIMFILRYFYKWDTKKIGRAFNKDHSTIVHHSFFLIEEFETYPKEIDAFKSVLRLISPEFEGLANAIISKLVSKPIPQKQYTLKEKIVDIILEKKAEENPKKTIISIAGEIESLIKDTVIKERDKAYVDGWNSRIKIGPALNIEQAKRDFNNKNPIKL